jgi:hypothetical protein
MNLHLVTRAEPLPAGAARAGQALRLLTGVRTTSLLCREVFYPAALIRAAGRRRPAYARWMTAVTSNSTRNSGRARSMGCT